MNIVVYFDGALSNPGSLFFCAQGITSKVNEFPSVPTSETTMHLKTKFTKNGLTNETYTYIDPAVKFNDSSKGNIRTNA